MFRPVPETPPPPVQHSVFHDPGGRRWRTVRPDAEQTVAEYVVAIRALSAALRGGAVGWGKLERRGTVQVPVSGPSGVSGMGERAAD